jgi:hypothetical protein
MDCFSKMIATTYVVSNVRPLQDCPRNFFQKREVPRVANFSQSLIAIEPHRAL